MQVVDVRPIQLDEVESLTACFLRCYGGTYAGGDFYEPGKVRAHLRADRLRSVVGIGETGEVVGHMAFTFRPGSRITADAGNTIVDPRCRGQGLMGRLGRTLMEAHSRDLVGYHNYPVTTHTIMQQHTLDGGGIETGLMLAYSPAETVDRGGSKTAPGTGRTAVVVSYQVLAPSAARVVSMPERYATFARRVYSDVSMKRTFERGELSLERQGSVLEQLDLERRGVRRLRLREPGQDLQRCLEGAVGAAEAAGWDVIQLDVPLSSGAVEAVVEAARQVGFTFSAILPEYLEVDILRMQRPLSSCIDAGPPVLVGTGSSEAQRIIERERVLPLPR